MGNSLTAEFEKNCLPLIIKNKEVLVIESKQILNVIDAPNILTESILKLASFLSDVKFPYVACHRCIFLVIHSDLL